VPTKVGLPGLVLSTAAPSETIVVTVELAGGSDCVSVMEAPESTPCPTLTTHPASLKALPLVLDTYEAAVRVCRGLSAQGV
jgi:hypothetical protein